MTDSQKPATAFVSGATSGIGEAVARRFLEAGWQVVATGRRADRLRGLSEAFGARCLPVQLDVGDAGAVAAAVAALPEGFRDVDVLVNSAGVALGDAPAQEASLDDWHRTIRTNVDGVVNLTHAFLAGMVKRNRGDIINIGSISGTHPYPKGHIYGATKAFVRQFTVNLRTDLVGTRVRATCIEPGTVETEFAYVRMQDEARARQFYAQTDLLRADDVADIVLFVAGLPRHVNITTLEVMSMNQGAAFPRFAER